MLLNLPIILSGNYFLIHLFKIQVDVLSKIHTNLLINTQRIIYNYIQITTLNRNETLSIAKDFPCTAIEKRNI